MAPRPTPGDLALLDPEGAFRTRLAADRKAVGRFLASENLTDLKMLIHRLAGAAGTFGYAEIGNIALRIDETSNDRQILSRTHRLLSALDRALNSTSA